jgi:cell division transport system permease protein
MFSLASIATIGACVFLFGLIFSLVVNFQYIVRNVEENVSVTVFFEKGADQATIDAIGEQIKARDEVIEVTYQSAEEAWDQFREQYFDGSEEAAEGFKNDNPLAYSSSYAVHVQDIDHQDDLVKYVKDLEGVRAVNQSQAAANTLKGFNSFIAYVSVAIIIILLLVAIFLISNTVATGIAVRREEIGIMKLIGATNSFVRAPFIIEGLLIGLIGATLPLIALYLMYNQVVKYILTKFTMLNDIIQFMSVNQVFEILIPVSIVLGMGIGFLGSIFTIRKHLKV